ncbi:MAG TPA: response regulator transcription factor [Gaiellaceae bacterium]|nr:response regulator transcription factor [Gaiellaceae bacterium]
MRYVDPGYAEGGRAMLNVLIVDDHPVVLEGLKRSLESDPEFRVVGEARDGAKVIPMIRDTDPDVVLLDMRMPGLNGLGCLTRIKASYPEIKVVMCSVEAEPEQIQAAFESGAVGYILKTVEPRDLPGAVRQAVSATTYQPAGFRAPGEVPAARAAGLTEREVEILRLVAQGLSNKVIARQLWVTEQTVKFHLSNLYRKLDITNRTEAARWAFTRGLNENVGDLSNVG